MTISYYTATDMLYIRLKEGGGTDSEELRPGFVVDYDANGRVVGIEIEHASDHVELREINLSSLPANGLTPAS